MEWALRQGMGGVTAWAIDLDDFGNRCCAEPSPLLRAAGRALGRNVPSPPSMPCERPPEPVTPAAPTTTTIESDGRNHITHFVFLCYFVTFFCLYLLLLLAQIVKPI